MYFEWYCASNYTNNAPTWSIIKQLEFGVASLKLMQVVMGNKE